MLNNVPQAINSLSRNVVVNHPNSYNCIFIRKRVTRPAGSNVGGLPTLGGMAVISSDDEESIEWDPLGNGYALQVSGGFQPSPMMDRQDANNGFEDEFRYLLEPETAGEFEPKKNDVFYIVLGPIRLAFEIVSVETTSNIPPFTQRYVCNRRDDLHFTV